MELSKRLFIFVILSTLSFTPSFSANSPLIVQTLETEPWGYMSKTESGDSQLEGIWIKIIDVIAQKTHLTFQLSLAPPTRIVRNLQKGDIDLTFLEKSSNKDPYVVFAGKLFTYGSIVIPRQDEELKLNVYDDLYDMRIGIVRGISLNPKFDNDFDLFLKQKFRNYEIIIGMLKVGRLDAVAGDSIALPYLLKKLNFTNQVAPRFILQKTEVWAQFSKKSTQLHQIPTFMKALTELRQEGIFEKILTQYAGDQWKIE